MNRVFRNSLIVSISGLLLFAAGCKKGPRDIPEGTLLTVYYSSDVRARLDGCGCKQNNGGIARRSSVLSAARAEDPDVIYCDAGNFLSGNEAADVSKGKALIDAYNRLEPAAVNVSEKELAFGIEHFRALKKDAKFDFVTANLRCKGGALASPYVIREVKDARIAFIGLCGTKDVMRTDSIMLPADVDVEDPVTATRRAVAGLEGKADVFVVLSTCGDAVDSMIAHAIPHIDLIIGGRSYRSNADSPWIIEKTRIVRAEHDGRSLGKMDMVFGPHNALKDWLARAISLDSRIASDEKMLEAIRVHIPEFREMNNAASN